MAAKNLSKLIDTASAVWKPSKIEGVQYLSLNTDADDRSGTFILKMAPGAHYPKHRHPAGEEIFLLKGEATAGGYTLKAGDFLYSPPDSIHEVSTAEGCIFVTILPKPIQIVPAGTLDEIESLPEIAAPPPEEASPDSEPYDPSLRSFPSDEEG